MRTTSSYLLTVRAEGRAASNAMADKLIEDCPVEVEASGIGKDVAFIRFRTGGGEEEAMKIAREIRGDGPYQLSLGYGIHFKVVENKE